MSRLHLRIIDCTQRPDPLAGWPVADLMRASETAAILLSQLQAEADWGFEGRDLGMKPYIIDAENRRITVNTGGMAFAAIKRSHYLRNGLALRSFAALRAAWQAERADEARHTHRPDLWPLLGRILAADVAVLGLRMAQEADDNDSLWRHALGDDYGDMAVTSVDAGEPAAFLQWFEKDARVRQCDFETLADMDSVLHVLSMEGAGQIAEGVIRCLTIDPVSGGSYLGLVANEIAGNPSWRNIADPVAEAHFVQIMDEMGATRVGGLTIRDPKLAARLFPELLENV